MTRSYGAEWIDVFGLTQEDILPALRRRYTFLKGKLVFQIDAVGIADPLTAFIRAAEQGSESDDTNKPVLSLQESPSDTAIGTSNEEDNISWQQRRKSSNDSSSKAGDAAWTQYFTDETLLEEINTDLDRLYPSGIENFFQNERYLGILRHVLFVWCKLHPDVSYRQGMHDVAAVVLYAFLFNDIGRDIRQAVTPSDTSQQSHRSTQDSLFEGTSSNTVSSKADVPEVAETVEADTFLVFEAIMLYLKPFYEVVKTSFAERAKDNARHSFNSEDEPRLFSNFTLKENDDPNTAFTEALFRPNSVNGSEEHSQTKQPALHRLCHYIQYELLQEKDPQLYYHLQNLEIVPETYCLRWIRLLFAREFSFGDLLLLWDAMFRDPERPTIQYPTVTANENDYLTNLPTLRTTSEDSMWIGLPLLRYVCVAKLLLLAPQLRKSDNSGCLHLLMHSYPPLNDDSQEEEPSMQSEHVAELIKFARILQNPMLEEEFNQSEQEKVDVVEFQTGSLGIVLTAASGSAYANRLTVKDFADDPFAVNGIGQAQASSKVRVGDLLESINGVPIRGLTTEEVKKHIQLVPRPLFMGFRHCIKPNSSDQVTSPSLSTTDSDNTEIESTPPDASLLPLFLPGELCYAHVETSIQRYVLSHDGSCLSHYLSGKLYITNYRCFFTRLLGRGEIDWQVPVLSIASIDGMDLGNSMGATNAMDQAQAVLGFLTDNTYKVVIRCKDTQVARLSFSVYSEYSKLFKCLSCLAFPANLLDAFCFVYSPTIAPSEEVPFDIRREYQRLGLLEMPDRLRCIDQSIRYDLCDTYPQHLIVPADMSDVKIKSAAEFRSHNRLPVVCWIHRGNGATISRSSQPHVGLKSARSFEDELLVRLICCSSSQHSFGRYVIMDARSQLAAVGNKAMGKGTEIPSNYRGSKLVFMNVDNIHTIRQSLQSITAIFEPRKGMSEESTSFYSRLESSGWLRHVRLVLKASVELAHSVHNGISVLTHCSDGWDRTAQMVSLAELMLDPYYRTLRGFQTLIEKEWCSFGYQFGTRCGHARNDVTNDQRSPVFLLWLDCVWQFLRQFPTECEFNESLLLALADHVFSCKYGTFMFDSERQRKEFFAKHRVFSIWSEINTSSERFTNQLYAPNLNAAILSASTLSKNIKYDHQLTSCGSGFDQRSNFAKQKMTDAAKNDQMRKRPLSVIPNEFIVPARVRARRLTPTCFAKVRWLVLRGSKTPVLAVYRQVTGFVLDDNPIKVMILGEDTSIRVAGEKSMVMRSSRVRKNDTWVLGFESSGQRKRMYELVKLWIELSVFQQSLTGFKSIAKSHNSVVYRCKDRDDAHRRFALKRMNRAKCWNEIEVTERVLSIERLQPYLAKYLYMFEDNQDNSVTIVMKYYSGGSLSDRLRDVGPLSELIIKHILSELCCSLFLLHENQILHLDVKAGNILFDSENARTFRNLKLVDFGSSVLCNEEKVLKPHGTYGCMAPERFEGRYGPESDVYGAGVVLYHMVTGELPFHGTDSYQVMAKNMQGDITFSHPQWLLVSKSLQDLAKRMLDKNPDTRITLPEILKMSWLSQPEQQQPQQHQHKRRHHTDGAPPPPPIRFPSSNATRRSYSYA